jgi:DNA-binding MarR family transcriptional regulator
MERRGLIIREECAEDGRGLMVRLTDAGRKAIEKAAPAHVDNVRRYFFDPLSDDELDTLAAVFDRLLEHLPQDSAPSPGAARPTP